MNRKLLVGAVSAALALPMAAQAVEFSVSGHVNRAIMVVDDGVDTDVQHMEGAASGSRFRFTGSEDLGNGMTAGVNMEVGLDGATHAPTGDMDNQAGGGLNDDGSNKAGAAADDPVRLRQVNVYFSGAFGKVTLGQQAYANDITQYASKDNYAWLGGIEAGCDFACGLNYRNRDGSLSEVSLDSAIIYSSFRNDLLRYDTPALGPAKVSVSVGNNDYQDASIEVGGDAGGFSYQLIAGADTTDKVEVSGAVGFAQGTNFSIGWARTDDEAGQEPRLWHAQVGHNFDNSSVSLLYQSSNDVAANDAGGTSWGVGVGHAFPDVGVEIYASFRTWDADIPDMDLDDMNIFVVGSRIKFN
jgi:predicted porin